MTVLQKSERLFQLEESELEKLIDAYSKDIRSFLLKISLKTTTVNVTRISVKIIMY